MYKIYQNKKRKYLLHSWSLFQYSRLMCVSLFYVVRSFELNVHSPWRMVGLAQIRRPAVRHRCLRPDRFNQQQFVGDGAGAVELGEDTRAR